MKTKEFGRILTQHDQESPTVSLLFYDLDLLSSYDGPTFLIKLLKPRVQESPAAKLKCFEIQERIWVFLETLLIVNMVDEILMNYPIIQEIWQTPSGTADDVDNSEKIRKSENSGSEEPLQSTFLPCFSVRARRKSRRQISLMSMTNHAVGIWTCTQVAWQFQVIYPRKCICISLTKRNFKAGSWIFKQDFAQKRRISRWYSSGSRDRSNPARWRTSLIQSQLRDKMSLERRLKKVFSGRQLGLAQEETFVVFYTRMPQAYSSVPKVRKQTDGKVWTVLRPVLRFKLKNICPLRTRWKISSSDSRHHPVCRGYKSGNMHLWLSLPMSTCW